MSGFRSRLDRLGSIPDSMTQASFFFEPSFEVEYFFQHRWNPIVVKPILLHNVVIFLVHFPGNSQEPIALVFNKRERWSDIAKESTGQTEAIGASIEQYYAGRHLNWHGERYDGLTDSARDHFLLN